MKISKTTWINFLLLTVLSVAVWYKLSYPQLAFVNFSIDREKALHIARQFLKDNNNNNIEGFKPAIVFGKDVSANRYLQKNIGFKEFQKFIKQNDFDLFFWVIRFFKENEKEEYRITISTATGQVTGLSHSIEDTQKRDFIEKNTALERAKKFLETQFGFDLSKDYHLSADSTQNHDNNRTDYSFTWQKNNVEIPWSEEANSGTAKLLTGATISGNDILSFSKNTFVVPEQFNRFLAKKNNVGDNISTIVRTVFYALFVSAIFILIARRNHLAMHNTKKFYLYIMVISILLSLLSDVNYFQEIIFNYKTTSPYRDYIWRLVINTIRSALFVNVAFLMPGLSGELLHFENYRNKKEGSFLYYLQTSFLSRDIFQLILLGYLSCLIMLGLQSLLIEIGERYLGVWVEYTWLGQLSTAYIPFLAALTIGFKASFNEEIMYRLFSISLGKKIFKFTIIAVITSALIWGFGHSNYPIYPKWFRGVEVSILGIFISIIYLRFGLITVLVAHYLFDSFWGTSGYLLGKSDLLNFSSSLIVLLLPLFYGLTAFFMNKKTEEKELIWYLNKHQKYNLEVLETYLKTHPEMLRDKTKEKLLSEITSHGWDIAVVDVALEKLNKENN